MTNNNSVKEVINNEYDINFIDLFFYVQRNKKLLIITTSIFFFISLLISYSLRKTWEGQFQIVLNSTQGINTKSNQESNLRNILIGGNTTDLKTQVEILKSPSVLMPIFQNLKRIKINNGDNYSKNWIFDEWLKANLDIKLKERTQILELRLRDKNKEIIIPTLNDISNKYQKYAINKKSKSIDRSVDYFEKELLKQKNKSNLSMKRLDKFTIDNNLGNLKNIDISRAEVFNDLISTDAELETLRIGKINSADYLFGDSSYEPKLLKEIKEIDKKIAKEKVFFTDDSKTIKSLLREKKEFLKALKENRIDFLENKRIYLDNILNSSFLDKETFVKYKELIRETKKDEKSLEKLEEILLSLNLQKAQSTEPWELITNPTLLDFPVAPSKKLIVGITTIFGFFIGLILCKLLDIKKGLIFQESEIESILNISKEKIFTIKKENFNEKFIEIFSSKIKKDYKNSKICFFKIGHINENYLYTFESKLQKYFLSEEIKLKDDVFNLNDYENLILILELGNLKKEELIKLKKIIDFQQKTFLNIFILQN